MSGRIVSGTSIFIESDSAETIYFGTDYEMGSGFSNGVYIMRVSNGTERVTLSLVITR